MIGRFLKSLRPLILLMPLLLAGCGGGGGGDGVTGTLALSMTDSTLPGFRAIYVTVDEVSVHPASGGGWTTVANPNKTVNLLELINGVRSELGIATLPTGLYTQMRLRLGDQPDGSLNILSQPHPFANYFIDDADQVVELKAPSGMQTGLKVVNGFVINENQTTELVLDFNAQKSVVHAGSSGNWLIKPTVKVLDTATWAIVNGTVEDGAAAPLEGILVSAQIFDPGAADRSEEVVVEAATVTDSNGEFALFLEPGSYNLVAIRIESDQAYGPDCAAVELASDSVLTRDFALASTDQVGQVAGTVEIVGGLANQHAVLSFRQDFDCIDAAAAEPIEVAGLNAADDSSYSVDLPAGLYDAVGSSAGEATVAADGVSVEDEMETTLDFLFD
jgi:hypothetical protein